mgnify:CR=1 FL=1|tara:strand:- start:1117 stop:1311 length:195 start_codon:yes stop_codon:yes gene_type:complete
MINELPKTRPDDVDVQAWKNRHLVSSKLTPLNYKKFREWCKKNNFSYSSGINNLIATYLTNHNV